MRITSSLVLLPAARDPLDAPPPAARSGDAATSGRSVGELAMVGASRADPGCTTATSARLQAIRAMLDKGNYRVDLDALAARIAGDDLFRVGRS
jgi:hypothetical protein